MAAEELARLVPELGERGVSGPPPAPYVEGEQARFRMFDAISGLLCAAAGARPLLLVLDDLHWADEASLALLVFFARSVLWAPIAIVATHREVGSFRSDVGARSLAGVLREPGTQSLELAGMERASVSQILERSLGRAPQAQLVERVHGATGGNPSFVSEVARLLAQRGGSEAGKPLPSPDRLRDAVRTRVGECSPEAQKVLRTACAIGPRVTFPLLARAVEVDAPALLAAIDEAERAGLLAHDGAPGAYRFAHGVVRETLYDSLGSAERIRAHGRVGEALEALSAADPDAHLSELAHHFAASVETTGAERAIRYTRRAAERARCRLTS